MLEHSGREAAFQAGLEVGLFGRQHVNQEGLGLPELQLQWLVDITREGAMTWEHLQRAPRDL